MKNEKKDAIFVTKGQIVLTSNNCYICTGEKITDVKTYINNI